MTKYRQECLQKATKHCLYAFCLCAVLIILPELSDAKEDRPCSPHTNISTIRPPVCASCKQRCGRVVDLKNQTSCSCDDHCLLYNDCCYDVSSVCPQEYKMAKKTRRPKGDRPRCSKIELNKGYNWEHKYLIVRSCKGYTSPCSRSKTSPYDYIPVVDPTTGMHFNNVKCAWCNGARKLVPWKVKATCKRMKLRVGEKDIVYMKKIDKFELLKEAIRKPVRQAQCRVEFQPPRNVRQPRKCLSDIARKCSETCENEDLKLRCEKGPLNYFASGSAQYRNHECLLCTNKWPLVYGCGAQGRLPPDPWVTRHSLSLLFDFDPRDGLKLGSKSADPPTCDEGYFWIEFKCRKLSMSPDIASGGNSSCKFVEFQSTEYILMLNGTLNVIASRKSYQVNEWKLVNGTMFICVNQEQPRRKSVGLGWTTLILLALSCTALSFRVLLHLLLPELQNLAGRMQTSLAAAMLTGKIAILCGPSQGPGTTGCHLVAALKHWALLAMFAWMSSVAVDIFRMLWMSTKLTRIENKKHTFLFFSIFAWGTPLFFLIVGEILNYTSRYEYLQPQYGMNYCWFNQR